MRRNVIIDCDPGHDDAIAIIVALANSEKLNVLGITTVAGNTTLDNATKNALRVLQICGKDIPVSMGYSDPLLNKVQTAAFVHGKKCTEQYDNKDIITTCSSKNHLRNTLFRSITRFH